MNMEKFTQKTQEAISIAQEMAIRNENQQIDVEHLHYALITQEEGLIPKLLNVLGINLELYIKDLEKELDKIPKISGGNASLYFTQRISKVLVKAQDEAKKFKDEYVSVEHVFLSILKENNTPSYNIIERHGVTREGFLSALSKIRSNQRITNQNPESTYEALERFGRDLVDMAKNGKLDPVIGRDGEIRRVIRILSRRTKNNPVLMIV